MSVLCFQFSLVTLWFLFRQGWLFFAYNIIIYKTGCSGLFLYDSIRLLYYMEEEVPAVSIDEIKKTKMDIEDNIQEAINNNFDSLLRKSVPIKRIDSSFKMSVVEHPFLDEKETKIYNFIADNPDTTKQNVVDFFQSNPGYSRNPSYATIRRLQQYGLITVKPDKNNRQKHRLSINNERGLVSLKQVLDYFKSKYLSLLQETKPFIAGDSIAKITRAELVECLIMLYKFTKDKFSDSLLWHGKLCDNDTLHIRFGIIQKCMHEIVMELYQGLFDTGFVKSSEEMEMFVNYSRSDVLGLENLSFIISSFEKCGLREYVEPIIGVLWMVFLKKLPLLYYDYRHLLTEGKLQNWRVHVAEEMLNCTNKRKILLYLSSI
jgi:hypothetical protein